MNSVRGLYSTCDDAWTSVEDPASLTARVWSVANRSGHYGVGTVKPYKLVVTPVLTIRAVQGFQQKSSGRTVH